jgi:transposase
MSYLELTPAQVWELRELTRTAVGRVALRALMILWRAEGHSTLEIAERLSCHRDTVSLWIERYRSEGLQGLFDEPRGGRPPKLDPAAREQVEAVLDASPSEADQPRACWTLAHLRPVFLQQVAQPFSRATLRRTVHALGFRFRRPRLWAHQEDPESFEKQLLVEVAKSHAAKLAQAAPSSSEAPIHFLYADASDHHLLAVLRAMWMRVGQQVRIATPPKNGKWALFGALHPCTGVFHWQAYASAVSEHFIAFLEYLLTCYPTGQILLGVDNASYHTSKAVLAWLKEHPRILLLYLPARRPDLNPVEPLWDALKEAVSANRSFANLALLLEFIQSFFAALTPARTLSLAGLRNYF